MDKIEFFHICNVTKNSHVLLCGDFKIKFDFAQEFRLEDLKQLNILNFKDKHLDKIIVKGKPDKKHLFKLNTLKNNGVVFITNNTEDCISLEECIKNNFWHSNCWKFKFHNQEILFLENFYNTKIKQ